MLVTLLFWLSLMALILKVAGFFGDKKILRPTPIAPQHHIVDWQRD